MTTQEILKLDTTHMSEEAARVYGTDILENNLAPNKATIKRRGSMALLFVSTYVILAISESPQVLLNVSLVVAAVAVFMFCSILTTKWRWKKMLQQFKTNTFKGGYVKFIKEYQDYLNRSREAQLQRAQKKAEKKGQPIPQTYEELEQAREEAQTAREKAAAAKGRGGRQTGKSGLTDIATRRTKDL